MGFSRQLIYTLVSVALALPLLFHPTGGVQLVLATLIQFGAGWPFYRGAWHEVRHGHTHMDTLVALGTSVAYGYSVAAWWMGLPELYFEISGILIALIHLGRTVEAHVSRHASRAREELLKLIPTRARVERDGGVVEVATDAVKPGDMLQIPPGELVPVDAEVVEGASHIDEASVTGEPMPVTKGSGDRLFAGTANGPGLLRARAVAVGAETLLGRTLRWMERAQESRAPMQRAVDRVAAVFVPCVVLLALVAWWFKGLLAGVSVLIIACPCALGMATPIVMLVASGVGARWGIWIRDMAVLQKAARLRLMVVDKTGTLTLGKPVLTEVVLLEGEKEEQMAAAAALARASTHPLSQSIAALAPQSAGAEQIQEQVGLGLEGRYRERLYRLGSLKYLGHEQVEAPEKTLVGLSCEGRLALLFVFEDPLRASSVEAVRRLHGLGLGVAMVTGDRLPVAQAVAAQASIDEVYAELLPDQKAERIEQLRHERGGVGMAGDGINDAAALAAADVGFAMGGGTQVAIEAADVTLVRNDLTDAANAIRLARATQRTLWVNLGLAFGYNAVAIPIAMAGLLNPLIAAVAMGLSSISVVANALTLLLRRRLTS